MNQGKSIITVTFDISGDTEIKTMDRYLNCLKTHLAYAMMGFQRDYSSMPIVNTKWDLKTKWDKNDNDKG